MGKLPLYKNLLLSFIYNSGGGSLYLACKWLITVLVARWAVNYEDAGNLALAMSSTNLFMTIATFSARNYQVSDIKGEFATNDYVTARLLTSFASLLLCAVFSIIFIATNYQRMIVITYMLFMLSESFSDVLHGIDQKHRRFDIIAGSFILRGGVLLAAFALLYRIAGLLASIGAIALLSICIVVFFDMRMSNRLESFRLKFNFKKIYKLLLLTIPLALSGLLYVLFATVPRNMLGNMLGTETLGGYASATTPSLIVSMAASFIFTPLVNIFSAALLEKDKHTFNRAYWLSTILVVMITVICYIGCIFWGEHLLVIVFGERILPYSKLLSSGIIVAGLTAYAWFFSTLLTIIRKLRGLLIAYVFGAAACVGMSELQILRYGAAGANYVQIISLGISVFIMLLVYVGWKIKGQ